MSYILDALKKSEQKRQTGQVPDLNTPQTEPPPEEKKSSWPLLLAGILLLNIIILAVVILRPNQPTQETQVVLQKDPVAPSSAVQEHNTSAIKQTIGTIKPDAEHATTQAALIKNQDEVNLERQTENHPQALDTEKDAPRQVEQTVSALEAIEENSFDNEAEAEPKKEPFIYSDNETTEEITSSLEDQDSETAQQDEDQADFPEDTLAETDIDETPRHTQPVPAAIPAERATPRKEPLHILQLPYSVQQQLPEIRIGAHFYSKTPGSRLASVNGKILREGHSLSQDLKVDEIAPDGVIFSYQKYLFHVPVF